MRLFTKGSSKTASKLFTYFYYIFLRNNKISKFIYKLIHFFVYLY